MLAYYVLQSRTEYLLLFCKDKYTIALHHRLTLNERTKREAELKKK